MSFIVAIDGPAGSGKGTITKLVGEKEGLVNIDTGAMFRCVTLEMIRRNIKIDEEEKIKKLLEEIKIDMKKGKEELEIYLNGEEVTKKIREKEVNDFVSPVSTIGIVREKLLELQRKVAEGKNVIMEGRDIGTVVFPNADVKIYLDATPEERARRRVKQNLEKGIKTTYEEALENVISRDKIDSSREIAPLTKAKDAIYLDSTKLTIEEEVEKIVEIIEKAKKGNKKENKKEKEKENKKENKDIYWSKSSKKFDKEEDTRWKKIQRRIAWNVLRTFYRIVYRIKIEGTENIPREGSFVMCGNHIDFVKVPVIVLFSPRKINFIGKAELFDNKILAWLGNLFDVIPVKRGKQDVESMKRSLKVLNKGEGLGLFPEGTTRGLEKGVKVKNGAAFMALRTGKPIVPVGVEVTEGFGAKITVRYGKPLDYSKYKSRTPDKETLDKVTNEMMDVIKKLANME